MKKIDNYKTIIFLEKINKNKFITKSNIKTDENIAIGKNIFPIKKIEISSKTHSFYFKKL